jgi:hypothetical protein
LTARFPRAALAALCTSLSWEPSRKRTGSSVSRPTSLTSFSVISAKARAAERWRSTLSLKERVVRAARGDPVKKLVVVRSEKHERKQEGQHQTKRGAEGQGEARRKSAHSQGTAADLLQLRARSRGEEAQTRSTDESHLEEDALRRGRQGNNTRGVRRDGETHSEGQSRAQTATGDSKGVLTATAAYLSHISTKIGGHRRGRWRYGRKGKEGVEGDLTLATESTPTPTLSHLQLNKMVSLLHRLTR